MDFDAMLKMMVDKNASDLFITAGMAPSLKIHGKLVAISKAKLTPDKAHEYVHSVMSPHVREEFENTHEANFAISASNIGRFRVSAFQQRNQSGMVLRKIETRIPTLDELHLPPILKNLAMTKRGLVLFVGGTGTGKSTSLAAMVGYRNQNSSGHIVSIEDPIEFIHSHGKCIITQREVGLDTDSYEIALKNTLRQAPDVILIGEIRARETMEHAIAFAETGHLCLSTMHANNANQALDRIITFFPEDRRDQLLMDLSMNLKAIVAQQLLPSVDGQSRRAAVEILVNTPLVSDYIRKGEIHLLKELMTKSTQQGMQTFDQALFKLYQDGEVSYDDAIHHADSANELRLMIKLSKDGARDKGESGLQDVHLLDDSISDVNRRR